MTRHVFTQFVLFSAVAGPAGLGSAAKARPTWSGYAFDQPSLHPDLPDPPLPLLMLSDEGSEVALPPATRRRLATNKQLGILAAVLFAPMAPFWAISWLALRIGKNPDFSITAIQVATIVVLMCVGNNMGAKVLKLTRTPVLVTAVQQAVISVSMVPLILYRQSWRQATRRDIFYMVPVILTLTAFVLTNHIALEAMTLSMHSVGISLRALAALPCELAVMPRGKRPTLSVPIVISLSMMVVGAFIYGRSTDAAVVDSWRGLLFFLWWVGIAVAHTMCSRRLLVVECPEFPVEVLVGLNSGVIAPLSLIVAAIRGELPLTGNAAEVWTTLEVWVLLLFTGLLIAALYSNSTRLIRKCVAQTVLVTENCAFVSNITTGILFFGDRIGTPSIIVGLTLNFAGVVCNGILRSTEKESPLVEDKGFEVLPEDEKRPLTAKAP